MNYYEIKETAKETGCRVADLISMTENCDPFYSGYEGKTRALGEWFLKVWKEHGSKRGVHLRRLHYWLMSLPGKDVDGEVYVNDEKHWNMMQDGGLYARNRGLVPAEAFVDRRNPAEQDYTDYSDNGYPSYDLTAFSFSLPDLWYCIDGPEATISGYRYSTMDQYYHLEVWSEKSTMDDVLIPICRRYDAVYKTFAGTASLTAVVEAIERQRETGKPCRIFYVSDFDLAGYRMPREVARKVEYWKQEFEPDLDICIQPIALTSAQIAEYGLPRTPVPAIKEGAAEARKKARKTEVERFEEIHGHGVTELDALEALHPGVLAGIVSRHLAQYRNVEIEGDLNDLSNDAQYIIDDVIDEIMEEYTGEIDEIRQKIKEIIGVARWDRREIRAFQEAIKSD